MTTKAWLWIASVLLLVAPSSAFALEMDYYTYNAFDESVAAFQRLALINSDSVFRTLALACVGAGVVFGLMAFVGQAHVGGAKNPLAVFMPVLIGSALFVGAVIPTGTLHVYDPVRNKYQAVGSVPDLVILIAGGLNSFERQMIRVIDTASANPYGDDNGTLSYTLLLNAMRAPQADVSLERSIARYYKDCGVTAIATNYNGVSNQQVLRDTNDLFDTFAKFAHPVWPTVWYTTNNDSGVSGSCSQAWAYLAGTGKLGGTGLGTPMAALSNTICLQAGFNTADGAQASKCDSQILKAQTAGFGIGCATSSACLRNYIIAKGITELQNDPDFSVAQGQMVNRQMMAEGFGTSQALNQWVPKLRGFMLASVIGVTPLILLFVMTPLMYRAMGVLLGLFAWLTLWGITDAAAVQMAADAAQDAFAQVKLYKMGYEAIMNTPDAAVQALGVFGKARLMAMSMATVIAASLLKFGGSAMTSYAGGSANDFGQAGEASGMGTMDTSGSANTTRGAVDSVGTSAQNAQFGFGTSAAASGSSKMQGGYAMRDFVNSELSSGLNMGDINRTGGAMQGGKMEGDTLGGIQAGEFTGLGTFGAASGAAAATTGTSTVRGNELDSAAKGAGFDSALDKAQFDARNEASSAGQQLRLADKLDGAAGDGRSMDSHNERTRLLSNSQEATIDGSGRSAATDLAKRTTEYERELGGAQKLEALGGDAAYRTGAAGSTTAFAGALGTEAVEKSDGVAAMGKGSELSQFESVMRGKAAMAAGGTRSTAKELSDQSVADGLARARISSDLAKAFGKNPASMQDRIDMSQAQNGQVSLALSGDERAAYAAMAVKSGSWNQDQAAEFMKGSGPATGSFAFRDGQIGAATGNVASGVSSGQMVRSDSGTIRNASDVDNKTFARTDTKTQDFSDTGRYGKHLEGAGTLLESPEAFKSQLLSAYKDGNIVKGDVAGANAAVVDEAVGRYITQRGFDSRADTVDQRDLTTSAQGGIDASIPLGRFGKIGVGGSVQGSSSDTSSSSTAQTLNTRFATEARDESRAQAVSEARAHFGASFHESDPVTNAFVAERTGEIMSGKVEAYIAKADAQNATARGMNDVREDLQSDKNREAAVNDEKTIRGNEAAARAERTAAAERRQ